MKAEQMSEEFDVLMNSYSNQMQVGTTGTVGVVMDEYEKSVYLTRAQKEVVESLYSGKNAVGDSFESDEMMRRYLSPLVREAKLEPEGDSDVAVIGVPSTTGSTSTFFLLPEDVWYITYESVTLGDDMDCGRLKTMDVVPVTQDEYNRVRKNPFRGPNKRRALRMDLEDRVVEIVSKYDVESYYVRYLRKPKPIVLVDLSDTELYIDGQQEKSEYGDEGEACELHEMLQERIIERAVREAVMARTSSK